jgi:hypothetical protein
MTTSRRCFGKGPPKPAGDIQTQRNRSLLDRVARLFRWFEFDPGLPMDQSGPSWPSASPSSLTISIDHADRSTHSPVANLLSATQSAYPTGQSELQLTANQVFHFLLLTGLPASQCATAGWSCGPHWKWLLAAQWREIGSESHVTTCHSMCITSL